MPTRAEPVLAEWPAAWGVLRSASDEALGGSAMGIDLVNKAKALGYEAQLTRRTSLM